MTSSKYGDFGKQIEALVQKWIDHAVDFDMRVDVVDQIRLEAAVREFALPIRQENDKLREALYKILHKCDLHDKELQSCVCSCWKYGTSEEIAREALE